MIINFQMLKKGLIKWYGNDYEYLQEDIKTLKSMPNEEINNLFENLKYITEINNNDLDEDDDYDDKNEKIVDFLDNIARNFKISINTVEYLWDVMNDLFKDEK